MRTERIADLYADAGPFASVHIDVSRDNENAEHQVELQTRAACEQLERQGAPTAVIETIRERLAENTHAPAPVSRTLVATEAGGVLLDEVVHRRTEQPTAVWGPVPDVSAWIDAQDATIPFVLALVDHEGGDVSTFVSDLPDPEDTTSVGGDDEPEHVQKVAGGGWSHMRYQNTSENIWARNAQAVAEEISSRVADGYHLVVLAGDPKSRSQVHQLLGDSGPAEVLELPEGGRSQDGGDEALHENVRDLLRSQVVARRLDAVHTLKDRLGRDEAVAIGVKDVADAFVRGQVDTLMLDPAAAAEHEVSPSDHPGLVLGSGSVDGPVRADLGLVAAAVLTGAEVRVSSRATLGGAPVAALLRWDQTAEGTS
jgi:hypothetical protein